MLFHEPNFLIYMLMIVIDTQQNQHFELINNHFYSPYMTSVLSLAGNVLAGMHCSNSDIISLLRFVRTIELALFVTDIVTTIFQLN